MKKLQIFLAVFLISVSIFAVAIMKVQAADPALTVVVSPASWMMDVGQSQTFSASASDGTGVLSYQWYLDGSAVSDQTGTSYSFVASSAGSPTIYVWVADQGSPPITVQSNTPSVTVAFAPTVSVAPVDSLNMNVDQQQTFTATALGGTDTLSYQWYLDGVVVSGQTASTYTYTAAASGSHTVYVRVTDSASTPVSVNSNTVSITVAAALFVSVTPAGPLTMDAGQTRLFTATALGGTGAKSYQWYLDGVVVSGQTASTYTYTAAASGSHTVYVRVTDSASTPVSVNSNTVSITVAAALFVSVTPAGPLTMDAGQTRLFTATALGGTGAKSYQWYLDGVVVSGQTASTYTYTAAASGSHTVYVRVTDSASTPVSVNSNTVSITVAAALFVSVTPAGPLTMDAGQTRLFTATALGGTGAKSYQWYLDGVVVSGQTASTYTYTAAASGSHTVYVRVTDSASTPVTSGASNAVSIKVNSELIPPTVSASLGIISQGQTSVLSNSSSVINGTSPYTYQWLQKAPSGSFSPISGATSNSLSFISSITTAAGTWNFILQVKDNVGAAVNSSSVSVTVNIPPLDHFVFSSVGTQTAGTSFSITITAKDASNNTLTNYVGTNTLNVSTGTINPITTGVFSSGVWTGSVTVTGADSGVSLFTTGSGMSGTSRIFTVNSGALNRFNFASISSPQMAGSAFSITVTAKDIYGNNVTGYIGTPFLIYSEGSISPVKMNAFVSGVGSTLVTVIGAGSGVTIMTVDGSNSGTSNSFTVTLAPTPTPTSIPTPTPTPSPTPEPTPTSTPTSRSTPTSNPTPTSTPKATPTPTSKPSTSPTPLETTVKATTDNGSIVDLAIRGNVTSLQLSNVTISTNQSAVSFIVTGESGTSGFSIMTIPKTAIFYGTAPVVFIDGQQATNQGYTQDPENFYVWYSTQFSTHQIKIQFVVPLMPQQSSFTTVLAIGFIVPEIVVVYTVIAVKRLRRRPENT